VKKSTAGRKAVTLLRAMRMYDFESLTALHRTKNWSVARKHVARRLNDYLLFQVPLKNYFLGKFRVMLHAQGI
jgi:hypothetical protein